MKILIVNKFLHPNGGSETYIFKLGEELIRQGHEVQYFGMDHEKRCVSNNLDLYTANMDFHTGKLAKLLYPFKIIYSREAAKKITSLLNDFKPDVVHINNFNFQLTPSIIYATRKWEKKSGNRVKIIFTAHDLQLVCPNHMMQQYISHEICGQCVGGSPWCCAKNKCIHGSKVKSILGSFEAWLYRSQKTYGLFDWVICPSAFLKGKLDTLPEIQDKTIVMHNFLYNQVKNGEEIEKDDYVLYFGRYSEEKGVRTLLNVCEELLVEQPELKIKFAGSGPLLEEVQKLANVDELGFLSGEMLANTVKKAKLFVFPSEWNENCPFTVMESQMYGTPVLASDIGGVPELLKNGETGELFTPACKSELKEKIVKLLIERPEVLEKYTSNCKDVSFWSVDEYAKAFIELCQK